MWMWGKFPCMKNLVTVTCERDFIQMVLQAESIQKYLESCNHYVIVNDKNPNIKLWTARLNSYYTNHKLTIIKQQDLFDNYLNYNGYESQQVCKFEIAKVIREDYLLLDSKNFFIKPTSLDEWDNLIGTGAIEARKNLTAEYSDYLMSAGVVNNDWAKYVDLYAEKLNIPVPDYYLANSTPFKVIVTDELLNKDISSELKLESDISEFIWYSLLNNDLIDLNKNLCKRNFLKFHTCFHAPRLLNKILKEMSDGKYFNSIDANPSIKVLGFHIKFIESCSKSHIDIINKWLISKEFSFQFQPKR